ncbi:DeoR/GlpR family DNA-binding transcription regulator [Bacillus massiliglaciei]|uniref:DeoR/GlpR family DNA-binding transcription regulator n=1 Tax=Bacillus massiliglaciei TaxID=1816693 RepID=UPI000AFEF5C6|nr:DeoR/GlpR family DNA-binding transcription regulator [Bacillus massiliglaciei]
MLTEERHQIILAMLKRKETVKLQELTEETHASESTIRRDLIQLEEMKALKRVRGGAALLRRKGLEPTIHEKENIALSEKKKIAELAASFIKRKDGIYLDAGTTTLEMIPFLAGKEVTVLTNGIMHLRLLSEFGIDTVIIGGKIKRSTHAVTGTTALQFLQNYRLDKCFLGMNGVHPELGFTTPDPEEAILKKTAIELSNEAFILADSSKLNEAAFAKVADVSDAMILTDDLDQEALSLLKNNPRVKVLIA